jgi:hypothetical protein
MESRDKIDLGDLRIYCTLLIFHDIYVASTLFDLFLFCQTIEKALYGVLNSWWHSGLPFEFIFTHIRMVLFEHEVGWQLAIFVAFSASSIISLYRDLNMLFLDLFCLAWELEWGEMLIATKSIHLRLKFKVFAALTLLWLYHLCNFFIHMVDCSVLLLHFFFSFHVICSVLSKNGTCGVNALFGMSCHILLV